MTPDELLDDYCREMELPIPPEGSKPREAILALIRAALRERPEISSPTELIDWMLGDAE